MNKKIGLVLSVVAAGALMLTGCGGSSSSTPVEEAYNGKLIDSAVAGVSYECGTVSGVTGTDGSFGTCPAGSTATFSIDGLTLGSSGATTDGIFFITDIVGVSRDAIDNEEVLKIAVLLQSLDSDGDPSNGITVPEEAAATIDSLLSTDGTISQLSAEQIVQLATLTVVELQTTYPDMVYVSAAEAEANLAETLEAIDDGTITGAEGGS